MAVFNRRNVNLLVIVLIPFINQIYSKERASIKAATEANVGSLRFVQVIARHGDRAPIHPYPSDPYKNETQYWPNGWYQLTPVGFRQQLQLGQYLRQRYNGFLPAQYSPDDFIIYSSNIDRAIQSAQACMSGLYSVNGKSGDPDTSLAWQAVPIHTIPEAIDIWINDQAICPQYVNLLNNFFSSSPEMLQLNQENEEFVNFIAEKSGSPGLGKVTDLFQVQDALRCEHFHNMTLPEWATDEVRNKLDNLKSLSFRWKLANLEMKRLRAGPMVGKLLENFRSHTTESSLMKMKYYSGHDSTMAGVMDAWDVFDPVHIPLYSSALIMELHNGDGGEQRIEIYYRNDSSHEPYMLNIPQCGNPCLLSKLEEISAPQVPTDWDIECQITEKVNYAALLRAGAPITEDAIPAALSFGVVAAGLASLVAASVGSAILTKIYLRRIAPSDNGIVGLGGNNYQSLP